MPAVRSAARTPSPRPSGSRSNRNGARPGRTVTPATARERRRLLGPLPFQVVGRAVGLRHGRGRRTRDHRLQGGRRDRPRWPRGGEPRKEVGRAEGVARAQSGERPRLREAAEHEEAGLARHRLGLAGYGVRERLVDEHDPPWRAQRPQRRRGVQHAGRVRRVADDDEIGLGRDGVGSQPVPVGGVGEHPRHRHARRPQRRLRLGEPGVHDRREPWPQRREQREPLRAPREDEHLVRPSAVPGRDGFPRRGVVRGGGVAGQVVERGGEPVPQPPRRRRAADVDREVEEPRCGVDVTVVAQRIHVRHPSVRRR